MSKPYVDHIGIIVDNLERSIALFNAIFGLHPSKIKELPQVGLRVAHMQAQNIEIELIQYTKINSFGQKVMGEQKGVNHLSLRVENMQNGLKNCEEKGLKVMEGFPMKGSHGRVAFFDPDTTQGVLIEICESQ
jgi:methylmalonyl-CoA/ethylmalonyl-CoA epimerase